MNDFDTYPSIVNSFYLAFYGRPADPAGLKFWVEQLANSNGDHRAIIDAFATSREAQVRFGDDTPAERIAEIYQQLFNRTPEQSGVDYWAEVVAQGQASLADVAIEILKGAQGTDKGLLDLRQQAVDAFTTLVETSGSDYAGYSSIEAARVLVRAVTPGASQEDIAQVVKATLAFADIASNNPAVIDAIATGSSLLALFDTARGKADPVVLAQALADVAAAAAGSPATLESLLRGGGMAQVLKVMPANATLQDVVNALAQGGLPAAIDVVYPPGATPTPTPPKGVTFTFEGVSHDPDDRAPNDHVTNETTVDIRFSVSGTLQPGQKIQYRHEGSTEWTDIAPVNGIIVLEDVDLVMGVPVGEYRAGARAPMPDHLLTVELRVADANGGAVGTPYQQEILLDVTDPHGQLGFVRIGQGDDGVLKTEDEIVDVTFSIDDTSDGVVQWRIKGSDTWVDAPQASSNGSFTLQGIDLSEDDQTIELRVIDAAGNVGDYQEWDIDGPAGIKLTLTPTVDGLQIVSPVTGMVEIGGIVANTSHASHGVVAGQIALLGQQLTVRAGQLQIAPELGANVSDPSGRTYAFGTGNSDTNLSGNYLWGYGGDDLLNGTSGDDYLFGGDGNDVIFANGGEDSIAGNAGADRIHLMVDGKASRIGYLSGDTRIGQFIDGGGVAEMDVISGAEAGDTVFISNAYGLNTTQVVDQYLTSPASGQVAVVRGDAVNGNFYSNPNGASYMVQWTDGNGINSLMVEDYAGVLDLQIDPSMRSLKMIDKPAVISDFAGINYRFSKDGSAFRLRGEPDDVIQANTASGLLDADGVTLYDFSSGVPTALSVDYTDGVGFGVDASGYLNFDAPLATGVYMASWSDSTFATASGRFDSGAIAFAGGVNGNVFQQVFNIQSNGLQQTVKLGNGTTDNGSDGRSLMYEVNAGAMAIVRTGTERDVVDAGGGALTVQYAKGNSNAQDLIFNFGANDRIEFHFDGAVEPEALTIQALGPLSTAELPYDNSVTMSTLKLELDGVVVGAGGVLVLVRDGDNDAAMLLYYDDKDGNTLADADEITLLATFSGGVPGFPQIDLIGMVSP